MLMAGDCAGRNLCDRGFGGRCGHGKALREGKKNRRGKIWICLSIRGVQIWKKNLPWRPGCVRGQAALPGDSGG